MPRRGCRAGSVGERLVTDGLGILAGKNARPAGIAKAVHSLGLSGANQESIERQRRRFENDAAATATLCFHPLAGADRAFGTPPFTDWVAQDGCLASPPV